MNGRDFPKIVGLCLCCDASAQEIQVKPVPQKPKAKNKKESSALQQFAVLTQAIACAIFIITIVYTLTTI